MVFSLQCNVAFLLKSIVPSSVDFQMWKAANIISIVPKKEIAMVPEMF